MITSQASSSVTVEGGVKAQDHASVFVGNTTIGTFNAGPSKEEEAQRHRQDVLKWLLASPEAKRLQDFIDEEARVNRKLDNTGLWFLQGPDLKNWHEGISPFVWLHGPMGCGKTTLLFLAIEATRALVRADHSKRLAWFYCTSRGSLGQDIKVLFRRLLCQLWLEDTVPKAIQDLYDLCDHGLDRRSPTLHELASALRSLVTSHPGVTYYILIDGFDELEASSRSDLVYELKTLVTEGGDHVHVFLASRDQDQIETEVRSTGPWIALPVDRVSVQHDIRRFVLSELDRHERLKKRKSTHEAILERVANQSNGMFRWAYLQMQALKSLPEPLSLNKVKQTLDELPQDLDETYDRMLTRLHKYDKPKARRALRWLLYSARQLYIEELVDACAIDIEACPLIDEDEKVEAYDAKGLAQLLQNLILIHPPLPNGDSLPRSETHTVMLVHASVREFLTKKQTGQEENYFALRELSSHEILARDSFAYLLCFNNFSKRHSQDQYPFRKYAWYHWEDHVEYKQEACVPTLSTATLRRRAQVMLRQIQMFLRTHESSSHLTCHTAGENFKEFPSLAGILESVAKAALLNGKTLQDLCDALKTPYFHPAYDDFFFSSTSMAPEGFHFATQKSFGPGKPLTKGSQTYPFKPLKHPNSIRLLEILPAVDPDTPIHCRLYEVNLDSAPSFAALSYTWAWRADDHNTIYIEEYEFPVLSSQLVLLRSMRSRTEHTVHSPAIWIDAICINQSDHAEKSAQVHMMARVFSSAREAVVGLSKGDEADNAVVHDLFEVSKAAMAISSSINGITQAKESEDTLAVAKQSIVTLYNSKALENALRIFEKPWWVRTWPIQEIVLASRAVVLYGTMSFNFDLVQQVVAAREMIANVIRSAILDSPGTHSGAGLGLLDGHSGWKRAGQMVQARIDYRLGRHPSLIQLLWQFRDTEVAQPMDSLLGLLGLCPGGSPEGLNLHYQMSYHEFTLELSWWILSNYKNLDLFSVRGAFDAHEKHHPGNSWAWPISKTSNGRIPLHLGVFGPSHTSSPRLYSAAGDRTEYYKSISSLHEFGVLGMEIDRVRTIIRLDVEAGETSLKDLCRAIATMQDMLLSSSATKGQQYNSTVEVRWRTILADQWPMGKRLIEETTFRGCQMPPRNSDEEEALLKVLDMSYDIPQLMRRVIIVTEAGYLGLASDVVEAGDSIVIMPGGVLPYALRSTYGTRSQLIGECYVHKCVDGQKIQKFEELQQRWWKDYFIIV